MENTTSQQQQQPYRDSPTSSPSSTPTTHAFTSASSRTIKPLPALPQEATMHQHPPASTTQPGEPYRDDPSSPTHPIQTNTFQRYTDSPPLTPDDDNIPLAHFVLNPYPQEAPPSYSVAVRQSQSYHSTLIQYIPDDEQTIAQYLSRHERALRPVLIEIDEESGEVVSRTDDVRHSIEKVVAMFVVAGLLLLLSGVLAWLALGSGVFGQ